VTDVRELQAEIERVRAERGFMNDPVLLLCLLTEELGEVAAEIKKTWSDNYPDLVIDDLASEISDVYVGLSALASASTSISKTPSVRSSSARTHPADGTPLARMTRHRPVGKKSHLTPTLPTLDELRTYRQAINEIATSFGASSVRVLGSIGPGADPDLRPWIRPWNVQSAGSMMWSMSSRSRPGSTYGSRSRSCCLRPSTMTSARSRTGSRTK